ncbi:avidin-related protein 1-like [Carcharodon carcharias]|uniref:avidin-related protein 1-like n=1 Tax=Carcharodon carcharias TaxID=13397 RepID=UPI001B7E5901|nr:avidin-related protein 1-like [Carcharodon carcharias]
MERHIFAISLCLLAFSTPGILADGCNMTGFWRNELGSVFYLSEAEDLTLNGQYLTAVEAAREEAGPERQAQVIGIRNNGREPTFSMSTAWAGGSITSWVGQCLLLEGGQQVLKTTWLLRSLATSLQDDWKSTRIGQDTFRQTNGAILKGSHR